MPCFHPLTAYRGLYKKIVFDHSKAIGPELKLPCGQCIGCRLERSRQWAVRLMHEASLHEDSAFLTLTYSPENVPLDGSLNKKHFQDFMKRLRQRVNVPLRYFHCGEYGEALGRPHYHCILYGMDFPDKIYYKSAGECRLYISEWLNEVWSHGFAVIGDVTFESAAYVARYVTKKVTGDLAKDHYLSVDRSTGVIRQDGDGNLVRVQPEYVTMSRRPGLASHWFSSYVNEVFPEDEVIARGVPCRPPRYYDKLFEAAHGDIESVKTRRRIKALKVADNNTPERLRVREVCAAARLAELKRGFEGGE